jgi:hypothetical protein
VFSAAIVDLVRNHIVNHDLALMSAFDGATAMADDDTKLTIIDQDGREFSSHLHSELMDYFTEHGLQ